MDQAQHCRKANNVPPDFMDLQLVSQQNKLEERRHQSQLILHNHLISNFLPSTPITTCTLSHHEQN